MLTTAAVHKLKTLVYHAYIILRRAKSRIHTTHTSLFLFLLPNILSAHNYSVIS